MSHFYGTMQGAKGAVTRCGNKGGGIVITAAGWGGAINVNLHQKDNQDVYEVRLIPWENSGGHPQMIATGKLDATGKVEKTFTLPQITRQIRKITRSLENPIYDSIGSVITLELYNKFG